MLYRQFPKAKENLSILGFGCMRLPLLDKNSSNVNEPEAIKMLRYAIDNGVNYMDTAWPYHGTGMGSHGQSEFILAKALRDGYRAKVKIATKLPSWLIKSREDMDRYLDEQLKALETDHIDYYLVHALNKVKWENLLKLGILDFLDSAINSEKIRFSGFSYHDSTAKPFEKIIDDYDWTFCQIQYNYLDEDYQAGKEGLEYAIAKNIGIVIMEPLKGGIMAANLPETADKTFRKANPERTPVDWALRWLWNQEGIQVVLSGMSEMLHVVENLETAATAEVNSLSEKEMETIEEVKHIIKSKVKVGCTACSYCMPCPNGVNIPQCFTIFNDYHCYDSDKARHTATVMYNMTLTDKEKASNCIECGHCESHCPQNIKIMDRLKEVVSTFETQK